MKKFALSSILLSSIVLLGGTFVQAEDNETDVNITVKPDEGHEETEGKYKNVLSIVHKPTAFRFSGTATTDQLIMENENPSKNRQFISVYDDRSTGAGAWKLEGKLGKIDKLDNNGNVITKNPTADQTTDLQGTLVINTSDVKVYDIGTNLQTINGVEDYIPAEIDETTSVAPNAIIGDSTLTLPAGDDAATVIMTSNATDKNGAYTNLGNAKFIIKAGSALNTSSEDFKYNGKITWTVGNQP